MANIIYNSFKKNLMKSNVNLATDTLKLMLVKSNYTPDMDLHEFVATVTTFEATGAGYTAGGAALQNKNVTQDNTNDKAVFDADDVKWSNSTITARYAVIYKDTGIVTTSPLIGCIDFGAEKSSENHDFIVQWDAAGIINLG